MDLYSRKIIAWMLSDTLEVCLLVIPAFFIAGSMVDRESFKYYIKLDIENPIIRINTAFKGCSSLEKISVLPRIYHN